MARHLNVCLSIDLKMKYYRSLCEERAGLVFVWPLTAEVEVPVVVENVWSAVEVTHSSSPDGYH